MKIQLDIAWAEASKIWAEASKLWAEASKLRVEGNRLWAEGNKFWADAVHRICGSYVSIEWLIGGGCIVAGVMEFLPGGD